MGYRISIISDDSKTSLDFDKIRTVAADLADIEFCSSDHAPRLVLKRAGGMRTTLFWDDQKGELYTTQPETDIVAWMMELAKTVGGRVRGQNFETYNSPFETYEHPDDSRLIEEARESLKRLRRKQAWLEFGKRIAIPAGVGLVVFALNCPWFWPKPPVFTTVPVEGIATQLANAGTIRADAIFVPLDGFDFRFVAELARQVNAATGVVIRTVPPIATAPVQPYPGKEQYDSLLIIATLNEEIERLRKDYGNGMIVFFTLKDINQGEAPTRFVFAHHDYLNRISMLSSHRLAQGHGMAYASREMIQRRMLKFSLRTVGEQHFALPRSSDRKSVMFSPIRSLMDVDQMGFKIDLPD